MRVGITIVTSAYFTFTVTDGAIRMLVLLHFYTLGYTPFMLAFLFLLYETAGIFANLGGGWLATRFGIPRMLAIGLLLQITGLVMLSGLDPAWSAAASVAWAVAAQGIAGVAKDITKTASKSAIKATSDQGSGQLFKWVAWFTGSKNATKGFGFFAGGLLLQLIGFRPALWLMASVLALVLVQALAPTVVRRSRDGLSREVPAARTWGAILTIIPAVLALLLSPPNPGHADIVLVAGLLTFGFAFAVVSSVHSYLILAYAGSEKAAEDVGFYYAANAAGRLVGILLSGALVQSGGMPACLWASAIMLVLCLGITLLLPVGDTARRVAA